MPLADLLTIVVYLLMLSIFPAWAAWFGLWFPLMMRKRALMTPEEREKFNPALNPAAGLQFPFFNSDAIRHDPAMRRIRLWQAICFCWPFGVVFIAAMFFNFVLPQIS